MMIRIPNVLTPAQVQACRQALETAPWVEGRATAGKLTQQAKNNMQVPAGHPIAQRLSEMILDTLKKNALFRSEEHRSELQSHVNLVCRLLLEKKKPRSV